MSKVPVDLNKLTADELKSFLATFDHVFSDCDGVVWLKTALPGSGDFFKLIERLGKTVHFVSNNSIRTKENYKALFDKCGIQNGLERLTIPSVAIAEYLKSIQFDKKIYCIASIETMNTLESYGYKCKCGPDDVPDYYGDFINYLQDDEEIGAVVFDSDFKVNLPKLYRAITHLKRPDVHFINGASDRYVPLGAGCLGLGTGVFTDIVTEETNRKPTLLGKPGKLFGEFAMKRAGVTDPSRVLFIGDMIEQDVGLGKATGFNTMLVLTSNSKEDMLRHESITPDYYATTLGDLVPQLQELL